MRRRVVATVLALCMVLGMLPGTAWGAEGDSSQVDGQTAAVENTDEDTGDPAADGQPPEDTAPQPDRETAEVPGLEESDQDAPDSEPVQEEDDGTAADSEEPEDRDEPAFDSYAAWKAAQSPYFHDRESGQDSAMARSGNQTIGNQYVEVSIDSGNGQFTMGTREGDPNSTTDNNQLLLFGHPDPWSSETLVRIDGTDYAFEDHVTGVSVNSAGTECVATAEINGVRVQQILSLTTNPYTGIEDIISIRYTYTNTSAAARQVGVRIMLDTMLGDNDGAPFRVNSQDVTSEVEFVGNAVPQYWQSFDNLENPRVTSTGFFYFNTGEKPDKVQFASWPMIYGSSWDYHVTSGTAVTGDSAVAAYFNPRLVAAGGSGSVVTYYGISGFSEGNSDLTAPLAVRVTAPAVLFGSDMIGGYLNNPFDVSVYMNNISDGELADVRAVLSLADAEGKLSIDASQSTTISVGAMAAGANETVQWSLRAIPQGTSTSTSYKIAFYSGSTLLKTLDIPLRLAELNESDLYRTVSFDLNGGDGTTPAPQNVLIGQFVEKPEDPTRQGYIFKGWYANPSCSGMRWFNFMNLYLGLPVTNDVTLYAGWEPDRQTIKYGIDTYQFINTDTHFFSGNTGTYKITGDYYDILMDGLSGFLCFGERQDVKDYMNDTWEGSCFGMSAVLSLVKAGRLDVDFFQSNAGCLHDLSYPRDSETVFNLINYYHLMQMTDRTWDACKNRNGKNETPNNKSVIDALDASAYPVLVCFEGTESNGEVWGHAVVAYNYETRNGEYLVDIWDPNDRHTPNTLRISSDYTTSSFDLNYDTNGTRSFIESAMTVESQDYDFKNLQTRLMERGYTGMGGRSGADTSDTYVLTTNYNTFTITDGTAAATVTNGTKTSGDLEISDADYLNEKGQEMKARFTLPAAATYTITNASGAAGDYRTVVRTRGATGFYTAVTAADNGTLQLSGSGAVDTTFDAAAKQSVTVVRNDATTPWYASTVEGTTTGMTVTPTSTATQIACKDQAQVQVSVNNDYNSASLSSVTVGTGSVALSSENGAAVIKDGSGNTLATGTLGHALIFCTLGGTPIEAQVNIPSGSTAQKPEDPTRSGFVFDGWYTDPDCSDEAAWSFSTPITADTRIYAKWLTNTDVLHTVTFRSTGNPDIIYIIHHGQSLTDIPAAPAGSAWDVTDFSNISSDMIVNATYGGSTEGVYTITFDANGGTVSPRSALTANGVLSTLPTPTRDNYYFAGWYTQREGGLQVLTSTVFNSSTTIYAHWSENPETPSTSEDHYISITETTGGSITPTTRHASAGERVTLYVYPDDGYELDSLTVRDIRGRSIALRSLGDDAYTFYMPAARVTVDAVFTKIAAAEDTPVSTPAEEEEPFTGLGTPGISGIVLNPAVMPFTDVKYNDWFYDNVDYVWKHYLMSGVSDTQFAPNLTTSRAMIWTILARMNNVRTDINPGSTWYERGMLWAMEQGVTDGTNPMSDITREQLAAMLWRNAGRPAPGAAADLSRFSDSDTVSSYAQTAVRWAASVGILNGSNGKIDPQGTATRAQVAAMVARYGDRIA